MQQHLSAFIVSSALCLLLCTATAQLLGGSDSSKSQPARVAPHGEITSLPGYRGKLPSRHFGGYISIGTRQLYYYLVESERSPSTDPVVLWLNGGPGCSSFDGFIYEQGPFLFKVSGGRNVTLTDNPYAWNKVANMIFLDSPSPVGLSYSLNPEDYRTNDTATAADSHAFLRAFFTRYPHFQGNDFYVSGESYAGVYVPMLTKEVVEGNRAGVKPFINIKGYLVGNGVTDDVYDGNAYIPFAAGKSLISEDLLHRVDAACQGNQWDIEPGSKCDSLLNEAWSKLNDVNIYNVLEECHYEPTTAPSILAERKKRHALVIKQHRGWPVRAVRGNNEVVHNWATLLGDNPPCTVTIEGDIWLNDPAVRAALHAAPKESTGPWQLCSSRIHYRSNGGSMLPIHDLLVRQRGLRALIYSGDHDMAVPHTGSEAWTADMHRNSSAECQAAKQANEDQALINTCDGVINAWQAWYNSKVPAQVAGYVVDYNSGMTYATIKGAGHMVPQTNPREALDMFSRFLVGQPLIAGGATPPSH